jgi:hypothetical protein
MRKTTCRLLNDVCFSAGFHESYTLPTTLGIYRPNCHELTTLNRGGSSHEFKILSFGGSTMSSVHYIPEALATALGVLSLRGHNGCILSRQSQARSGGNRTLGLKSMAQVCKSTPVAPSSPLRWQPYLGPWPRYTSRLRSHLQASSCDNCTLGLKPMARVLKPTPASQVNAKGRTQAHSGGTSRLRSQS